MIVNVTKFWYVNSRYFFVQNDNALIMTWLKCRRFLIFFYAHSNIYTCCSTQRNFSQLNTRWILCCLYKHFIMRILVNENMLSFNYITYKQFYRSVEIVRKNGVRKVWQTAVLTGWESRIHFQALYCQFTVICNSYSPLKVFVFLRCAVSCCPVSLRIRHRPDLCCLKSENGG